MSFLKDNFSSEMRPLGLIKKIKTKNSIGETVESESTNHCFSGIILLKKPGYDKMIDGKVPINISSHILYTELCEDIGRDDIVVDQAKRFIVKNVEIQVDFGGKEDHKIIYIDHIE